MRVRAAGALATGFLLIPLLGVVRILDCAAALLLLPALAYWARAPRNPSRVRRYIRERPLKNASYAPGLSVRDT